MAKHIPTANISAILLFCCTATPTHAYLDPGTGSILLQGLIGAIAAGMVVGKLYWHRFKTFVGRFFGRVAAPEQANTAEKADEVE